VIAQGAVASYVRFLVAALFSFVLCRVELVPDWIVLEFVFPPQDFCPSPPMLFVMLCASTVFPFAPFDSLAKGVMADAQQVSDLSRCKSQQFYPFNIHSNIVVIRLGTFVEGEILYFPP
jgi:hypothetical protein